MTTDDIIRLREQADDWAEKRLQCEGEYHPDFHAVSDERFASLLRERMLSEGWRQCAQGQRTSQFCGMVEQARQEERERLASAIDHQRRIMKDHFEVQWLRELATAIRARGTQPCPDCYGIGYDASGQTCGCQG